MILRLIDTGKTLGFLVNSWICATDRWIVTAKSWCVARECWNGMLYRCQICEPEFIIDNTVSTRIYYVYKSITGNILYCNHTHIVTTHRMQRLHYKRDLLAKRTDRIQKVRLCMQIRNCTDFRMC